MTDEGSDRGRQGAAVDLPTFLSSLGSPRTRPTSEELRTLKAYVATKALRQSHVVPAPPEISGERLGRRVVRTGDPIDVRLAKYLRHAVRQEHWPSGTTFDEYLQSLVDVVESDESGVFADQRGVRWILTFAGRSGIWEGLDGGPFIVVMYDCLEERLITAFQPERGLRYVEDNEQVVDGIWLRRPS
jgi:hypothetical protein